MVERNVEGLQPHPVSKEIYQQDRVGRRFLQDIKANGVEQPIVINTADQILDGVRRWLAVKQIDGIETVECEVRSYADEEKAILRLNDDRNETFRQKMEVAMRYKQKASEALEERMKVGESLDEMCPEEDPAQEFAGGENATARELAADRVGWSGETLRKAEKIWRVADPGTGNFPHVLVEAINLGEMSISAAYSDFREWQRAQQGRARVQWSEYMEMSNYDQMFDVYENHIRANLADVDPEDDWKEQIATLRDSMVGDNLDWVENSDFVFAWHLEKRGLLHLEGEEGPESIVAREPESGELERLYWDEDYTIGELAMYFGVNVELIKAWMREKGVSLRFNTIQQKQVRERVKHQSDIIPEEDGDVELPEGVKSGSI